mmetsp:Transcript_5038/g.7268  ORF Transcript_5038/g.7268 Transcript_5038/m.7268 type:complete len:620 (-) Transcript_5038:53-1912(-)
MTLSDTTTTISMTISSENGNTSSKTGRIKNSNTKKHTNDNYVNDTENANQPFCSPPLHIFSPILSLGKKLCNRLHTIYTQTTPSEISGSLGDLGTLIPLLVALSRQRAIRIAPALFFGGLSNVLTGLSWDVPICVQPMKSIAAVALSEELSSGTVTAAGMLTGGLVLFLGVSNLIEVVNAIVPSNVVAGLQIGVGLRLAAKGILMVNELSWCKEGYDCILLAIACSILCLFWLREHNLWNNNEHSQVVSQYEENNSNEDLPQQHSQSPSSSSCSSMFHKLNTFLLAPFRSKTNHPIGIYLFLIGSIFAIISLSNASDDDKINKKYDLPLRFFGAPIAVWALGDISAHEWKVGFLEGAIPQIPLTTLNSVISVCALAHSLYPEKRVHKNGKKEGTSTDAVIGRREMAVSVGLINVLFCPFGSMPNCHGAGGLAGQHRLGARHGASVFFLGSCKIILAIFFGASALTLLDAFPKAVLGVMLAIAGQELATTGFTLLVSSVDDCVEQNFCWKGHHHQQQPQPPSIDQRNLYRKTLLRQNTVISTITTMVIVALGKTHYGALSGWVAHMIYGDGLETFRRWIEKMVQQRSSKHNKHDIRKSKSNDMTSFKDVQKCGDEDEILP